MNKKVKIGKKIGVDVRVLMDKNYSGVSEFTYELLHGLLRIDKLNQYYFFCNSFFEINEKIKDFEKKYNNVKIVKTSYPNKLFNYFFQKVLNYPKIDRVIGVDIFFMPHINFISLTDNSKKVITIHDLSFLRYGEFFSLKKKYWHKQINVKKLLKSFDRILAVSENTKKDIIDLCGIAEDRVEVVYPGVSDKYRKITDSDVNLKRVRDKYNLSDKFFLYLGTIEPRKNICSIIKAFDLFVKGNNNNNNLNYQLILAGGTGWKNKQIFRAWKKSKNKRRIKFLGYIPNSDKVYLYNLAKVFVYPSFYEGFGFPPLEALLCGKRVIIGRSSSLGEVAGEMAIAVDPYNLSELITAMNISVVEKVSKVQEVENVDIIRSRYNWDKISRKYLEIFNSLKK